MEQFLRIHLGKSPFKREAKVWRWLGKPAVYHIQADQSDLLLIVSAASQLKVGGDISNISAC